MLFQPLTTVETMKELHTNNRTHNLTYNIQVYQKFASHEVLHLDNRHLPPTNACKTKKHIYTAPRKMNSRTDHTKH